METPLHHLYMSRDVRKPVFRVSDQVRHKTGLYSHRRWLRDLKFRIWKAEGLYDPSGENKGADQLRGHREAENNLRICFRICKKSGFLTSRLV